jgi:hypothetical protein
MENIEVFTRIRTWTYLVLLLAITVVGVQPTPAERTQLVVGQTIYVPVYSHVYFRDKSRYLLAVTLSIRNTDLNHAIMIHSVQYYDTAGQLVQAYLSEPLRLAPLASTDFVVAQRDQVGGSGANFIVEWQAKQPVNAPILEAVMVGTMGTQGISFVSPGRVISK